MGEAEMEDDSGHYLRTTSRRTGSPSHRMTAKNDRKPIFTSRFPPPEMLQKGGNIERPISTMTQFGADSTLGQFSFAPATQTTVVTTTTTTTTRFPPFVMRAPRRMEDVDPKLYPLASTPTPREMRKISFQLEGKQTIFREADDLTVAMEEIEHENQILKANGAVQTVQTFRNVSQDSPSSSGPHLPPAVSRESAVSPDTTAERPQSGRSTRSTRAGRRSEASQPGAVPLPGGKTVQRDDPATPATDLRERRWRGRRPVDRPLSPSVSKLNTPTLLSAHPVSTDRPRSAWGSKATPSSSAPPASEASSSISRFPNSQALVESVVPTPPIQGDEPQFAVPQARRNISSVPSRLIAVDTSLAQDGSLPSPSLSPVTAAANIQNAGYFADVDSNSELASQQDHEMSEGGQMFDRDSAARIFGYSTPQRVQQPSDTYMAGPELLQSSVNEIPAMIDFFEAIPDGLKSYVMHQLLRRCPKPTLQFVADVVSPALKCDFVGILPPELSLNILRFLDAKSLCRASQVSRKWRHIVNSDEQAWKDLFDADGLSLPPGELQRAILEGWGWQDPIGVDGWEKDISVCSSPKSESDTSISTCMMMSTLGQKNGVAGRRPKRKAASRLSNRSKQPRRRHTLADASEKLKAIDGPGKMLSGDGPYHAANAAAMAVPYPKIGLSSLKDLHLYKSLYRRHFLIRKMWMREDVKPRHIAFRAHDRHVVTCLGFDDDKIVTGSDDTNINVYDTKTGALRAKLRGHEGGVWALQYEGNVLVSGSTDRSVRVWDIEKGQQMHVFPGHTSTVRCLQILSPTKVGESLDGKPIMMPKQPLIITGSRDSTLRVWKLPQQGDAPYLEAAPPPEATECPYFIRVLTGHTHSVRAIAAHADTLVSGSYDCTVRVWKISTGETVHRLTGHTSKVYSVVLDHVRNRCISGSMDNLVKIWSLDTGSVLYTLDGHSSLVGLLDLNSERLVSAAADSTLRIWDPENGQCKATLSAHTGAITCFQHDGLKVISGSDRTLKMWNMKNGECVKDLLTDLSGVWQVRFNERRCVAAVQRNSMTYVEVLDFGAARDGVPEAKRGQRIVVDLEGTEIDPDVAPMEVEAAAEAAADDG